MKYILILTIAAALLFCGCQHSRQNTNIVKVTDPTDPGTTVPVSVPGQLLAIAQTLADAQKIAELYGIELVSYQDRLAVFYTEEDAQEVIQRGEENGWPPLSPNYTASLY